MSDAIPWVFYVSAMGRPVVEKELTKLGLDEYETALLKRAMTRVASGNTQLGDIGYLGRDVWELRVRFASRIIRLLYFIQAEPYEHIVVLAALKKTQKIPPQWINLAIRRREEWFRIASKETSP
jgi:phage-related protein